MSEMDPDRPAPDLDEDDDSGLEKFGPEDDDDPGDPFPGLRRRDEELTALGWLPEAAAFHLATRWRGRRALVPTREGAPPPQRERKRPPLAPFHERGGERVPLPAGERQGELYRVLHARRTARSFDGERPLTV